MTQVRKKFPKGIRLKSSSDATTLDGEIRNDGTELKANLDSAERTVVTEDQVQDLTNKTIDGTAATGSNTITADADDITYDNGVSGLSATDVKAAIDELKTGLEGQDQASEITFDDTNPNVTGAYVQDAIDYVADITGLNGAGISNHVLDAEDAHTASAITNENVGNLEATDVQGALNELQTELDGRPTISETLQNKTLDSSNIISGSIESPVRSDVKQGIEADLVTYAGSASDGQIVFATDTQKMYQIINNSLEAIGGGGSTSFEVEQIAHGLSLGDGVYHNGTIWVKGLSDAEGTVAYYVVTSVEDVDNFIAADFGRIEASSHGFTVGQYYFLSDVTPGLPTTTLPSSGYSNPLFYVEDANTLQIKVYRPSAIGNNITLDELSDVSVPSPSDGDLVQYVSANNRYENTSVDGDLVGTTGVQVLTNKDIDGGTATDTSRITLPKATKATLDALTRKEGTVVYATDDKQAYLDDGADLVSIGSGGSGGINYIENPSFNDNIDGVTGDTNLVVSQETVAPLREEGSLKIAKGAIDASGQEVVLPFTIDTADLAKKLTGSFDYDFSDANYADGDMRVEIKQDPSGTPSTIRVNGEDIKAGKGTHYFQFQTDAVELEYELVITQISTGALAVDALIDNVSVGPTSLANGAIVTDWEAFTPTGSWTTSVGYSGFRRRVGDVEEYQVRIGLSAGPTPAVALNLNLENTIDISKIVAEPTNTNYLGIGSIQDASGATYLNARVSFASTTSVLVTYQRATPEGTYAAVTPTAPFPFVNTDHIYVKFSVPIEGWSSNAQMSEDLGGRDIAFKAFRSSTDQTISSATPTDLIFNSIDFEYGGSGYDIATGEYTAQESGRYSFEAHLRLANQASEVFTGYFLVQGSSVSRFAFSPQGTGSFENFSSGVLDLIKGDVVKVQIDSTADTSYVLSQSGAWSYFTGYKLASPQTILETETVAAIYKSTNGQSIPATTTLLKYEVKVNDTHNAYNISTGVYTAPASGYYRLSVRYRTVSFTPSADSNQLNVDYFVNASTVGFGTIRTGSTTNMSFQVQVDDLVYLNKGDALEIKGNSTTATTMNTSSTANTFAIHRVK